MKPGIILLFVLVVLAVYFILLKPKSSSKFGAVGDRSIPPGVTNITLAIKNLNGATLLGNVTVPLNFSGSPFTTSSTSLALEVNYYGKNLSDTTAVGTWIKYSVGGVQNPAYYQVINTAIPWGSYGPTSTTSGKTQCIALADATKWGYTTSALFAKEACANTAGYSGSTDTTGAQGTCAVGSLSFTCTQTSGNVTISVPGFGSTYTYTAKYFDSTNTAGTGNSVIALQNFPSTSTTVNIAASGVGTISVTVTPPSGTASIYYWTGGGHSPNDTAKGSASASSQGTYTIGGTITIPSLTVTVTVGDTAKGLITAT